MATKLTENQKRDYDKFYVATGEPGFSPEYNEMVINKTIEKHEAMQRAKRKKYREQLAERVDAIRFWANSISGSHMPIERYLGRRELAKLQGQKILEKVQLLNGKRIVVLESLD